MRATCCWCKQGFQRDRHGHYWCVTEQCRKVQAQYAIAFSKDRHSFPTPFYVPLPKQVDFERAPVRYLLGGGAAGSLKSTQGRYGLYRRALAIPGFEGLILRRTWPELEKHHLRLMEREAAILREKFHLPVLYLATAREIRFAHPGGVQSVIEAGHMENPEDIDKYLSRERDAIVADEGSTFDPQKLLELSTRARSTKAAVEAFARKLWNRPTGEIPGGGAVFWVLSNPGGPASSMLRDFLIDRQPNFDEYPQLAEQDSEGRPLYDPSEWGFVPGNLEDNPYLSPGYERDLAVLPPWRYKQLRFGNWDVIAGEFFVEFDERTHVKDLSTPSGADWFRSYDYGFVHKGVCLWWAILPDGRLYIRTELKHQYLAIPEICHQIRQITRELGIRRVRYTVADKLSMGMRRDDVSGETRGETFALNGVPVIGVQGQQLDREQQWTRVRELLAPRPDGTPWLILHPSCRQLIRELSAAISDKNRPEDISQNCEDDALSALGYGAMSRPSTRTFGRPPLPPHAIGRMLEDVRRGPSRQTLTWR